MPITATFGIIFLVAKVDVAWPTRTRDGREYADEVKPSEDAAATPIPLRRQTIYYLKSLSSPNISLIFEICFFATLLYRGKIFYHRFLYNDEKNMSQRKK